MKRRLIALDLFRIFLAVVVFMFHSNIFAACDYYSLNVLIRGESPFMTGFFILSGFSLFYSMKDRELSQVKAIKDFYLKRLVGILPLYWVVMVVYHLVWGEGSLKEILLLIPMDLLGLRSTLYSFPNNQFIWFVSDILFCYLVYPFLHQIIRQISVRGRYIFLGILLLLEVYITALSSLFDLSDPLYYSIFYRIVEFAIGMLLVTVPDTVHGFSQKNLWFWGLAFLEGILLLLGLRYIRDPALYAIFQLFVFCGLFPTLALCQCGWLEKSAVVKYVTSCTYSLFLSQIWTLRLFEKTVPDLFDSLVRNSNGIRLLIVWTSTLALTVLLHEAVEKPCKKLLLDRWNR